LFWVSPSPALSLSPLPQYLPHSWRFIGCFGSLSPFLPSTDNQFSNQGRWKGDPFLSRRRLPTPFLCYSTFLRGPPLTGRWFALLPVFPFFLTPPPSLILSCQFMAGFSLLVACLRLRLKKQVAWKNDFSSIPQPSYRSSTHFFPLPFSILFQDVQLGSPIFLF